jgi:uncharacterized delta-60 repeat protein
MKIQKSVFRRILIISLVFLAFSTVRAAGEVDLTFNGAAHGDLINLGAVHAIKRQPDGKLLIGGTFTEVQGFAASGLARLNADGTVDTTFNTPDFQSHNPNNGQINFGGDIFAIAVQPDGKILVGGSIFLGIFDQTGVKMCVRRLNADGSIDPTFFIERLLVGSVVYDIELQADGKILLGGLFTLDSSATTKGLARLNADGTRDATFSATFSASNLRVKDMDIQPDGKIVAGGYSVSGTPSVTTPFVRRFNTDGTDDPSFTAITSGSDTIEALKLQTDGKILVGGNFPPLGGVSPARIARLNADGTIDSSFGPGGGAPNAIVNDIAIRPDGKIIIGGNFASFNAVPMQRIARLNTDGTLDNTFTNSGTITNTAVNDVELLPDNRILAGVGTSTLVDPLLRFSADGAFDSSYVVKITRGGTVYEMLQQPDGKVLVAGEFLYANGVPRRSLARFNADGTLDTSFVPYFNNALPPQIIYAIALQADGKILVGAWHGIVFQRLNTDGSQDTSFTPGFPSSSQLYDIAVQADGKILVGGLGMPTLSTFGRYNSNGTRDATFNPAQPGFYVRKVFVQSDGKLLVGGAFSTIGDIANRNGVARYNPDGVLDNAFIPPNSPTLVGVDIDVQADGKVLVVGNGIRRLNSNGTLDVAVASINSDVSAVKYQPDGRILIGGGFSLVNSVPKNGIARFTANLALDGTFTTFSNRNVNDIQLQLDGKILIGGGFTKVDQTSRVRIARLLNVSVPTSTLFDYDGDGRADVSVFRPSENRWYVFRSSDSVVAQQVWAIAGDVPVPADYDGDFKTDYAIFRPSSGDWWYLSSINGAQIFVDWGQSGDIPLPSDFDGDGKSDYIVFRPSNSTWNRISNTGTVSNVPFGLAGDKPVRGDFDGDGKSDPAIFRPSTGDWWYQSSISGAQLAVHWGISTDIPAPADFDGDGKTDFAVYRPSTGVWYIINSSNFSFTIMNFGIAEDKPVPADYDGDGKADIAVFRPSTGIWYQMRSTQGFMAQQFGISSDVPTPNAFVP